MPVVVVISGRMERLGSSDHSLEVGGENFVDPPALTVVFEEADAELDDLVAIGVDAGGLDIHDGRLLGLWAATRLLGEIGGLED
jgi:hypothetical protein